MCGRLACGLEPDELKKCCCYKDPHSSNLITPQWKHVNNSGKVYKPSFNICPTELAPVLVSGDHFNLDVRAVVPTVFGLIPSWSKADAPSKYSTINCRIENIKTSKLYWPLLEKGQRCIVICNGFYEWMKGNKESKKPYFVHSEQPSEVLIDDPDTWNVKNEFSESFQRFRPLQLAALFERQAPETENEIVSFAIITKEASTKMSWLHSRMPATIDTNEQLQIWLDNKNYDADQALQCLSHFENVIYYPVATSVNFTSNKDVSCIKQNLQTKELDKKETASSNLLKNWLSKRENTQKIHDESVEEAKKMKY